MKVRCINKDGWVFVKPKTWWRKEKEIDSPGPKYGDIVTVEGHRWSGGVLYYTFIEWPDEDSGGYQADCFLPIEEHYESVSFEKIKEKASIN